jgi:dipeptidyl-peptidase-4
MPERDIYYYAKGGLQNNRVDRALSRGRRRRATIGVVDLATGKARGSSSGRKRSTMFGVTVCPRDGKRLFVSGSDMEAKEHSIYLFDVASGTRQTFYQLREKKHLRPGLASRMGAGRRRADHTYRSRRLAAALSPAQGRRDAAPDHQRQMGNRFVQVDTKNRQLYFLPMNPIAGSPALPGAGEGRGDPARQRADAGARTSQSIRPTSVKIADWYSNDDPARAGRDRHCEAWEAAQVTKSPQPEFYGQTWARTAMSSFPAMSTE